jgi:hypothetical protein
MQKNGIWVMVKVRGIMMLVSRRGLRYEFLREIEEAFELLANTLACSAVKIERWRAPLSRQEP